MKNMSVKINGANGEFGQSTINPNMTTLTPNFRFFDHFKPNRFFLIKTLFIKYPGIFR
jgi:hypothetical protein